jgi:hypothetical protein
MKKLAYFSLIVLVIFCVACEKSDPVVPNPPPPPPPPVKKVEVKIKTGPLPADCLGLNAMVIGFRYGEVFFTPNAKDLYRYPEFTYSFSAEHANEYLGKKVELYVSICREFPPGNCWGLDVFILFDPLKEFQEVYIEIPPRDMGGG